MPQDFDPIAVVEAAYRFDLDADQWLAGVSRQAAAFFEGRRALVSFVVDTRQGLHLERIYTDDCVGYDETIRAFLTLPDHFPPAFETVYYGRQLDTMSGLIGMRPREHALFDAVTPAGVEDYYGVACVDPSGVGVHLGAVMNEVVSADSSWVPLWNQLSTHISAGFRLRRTYEQVSPDAADAVITPSGEFAHAASSAAKDQQRRQALCRAAVNIDRARSQLRKSNAGEALKLWKGMVDGVYSLVEYFDHDGRRYYVARRNPPATGMPRSLSRRERQVVAFAALGHDNRRIAYELGLSESTIATYLQRARKKLGVASRLELVRLARDLFEAIRRAAPANTPPHDTTFGDT